MPKEPQEPILLTELIISSRRPPYFDKGEIVGRRSIGCARPRPDCH